MGNSNGRSCGSIQAGEYGSTGFVPAAEGTGAFTLKVQVVYKGSAEVKAVEAAAAVPAGTDAAGKPTAAVPERKAVAYKAAVPDSLLPELKDLKETKWSADDSLGSILAGWLYNLDKALDVAKDKYDADLDAFEAEKRTLDAENKTIDAENKAFDDEKDPKKKEGKSKKEHKKATKTKPTEVNWEARKKELQEFKAGWFAVKALTSGDEGKRGSDATNRDLNATPKTLGLQAGQTVIFAYDGAAALPDGTVAPPAPKKEEAKAKSESKAESGKAEAGKAEAGKSEAPKA